MKNEKNTKNIKKNAFFFYVYRDMVQRPSNFAFEIIKRNNYVDYFYSILYAFSFVKRREAAS